MLVQLLGVPIYENNDSIPLDAQRGEENYAA
jgi:hypothetical protein